jgi:hypothetical protein
MRPHTHVAVRDRNFGADGLRVPLQIVRASAAADRMLELNDLSQAELEERGHRYLTILHGDIETAEQEAAVHELSAWATRHPSAVARTIGTNDRTTWLFTPPNADANRAALQALA